MSFVTNDDIIFETSITLLFNSNTMIDKFSRYFKTCTGTLASSSGVAAITVLNLNNNNKLEYFFVPIEYRECNASELMFKNKSYKSSNFIAL